MKKLLTGFVCFTATYGLWPTQAQAADSNPDDSQRQLAPFVTHSDHPHMSHTSKNDAVHVHGWWTTKHPDLVNKQAVVKVQMQSFTDARGWFDVGPEASGTHRPGGGGGNRTTGHWDCKNNAPTKWRAIVDVDVIGVMDTPGKHTSAEKELRCGH